MNVPPAGQLAGSWGGDPGVLALLLATVGWYAYGARRRPPRGTSHGRDWAFAGAMGAIVAALASPVDAAARSLFWAHMVQHLLLVQVAAPLLVLAAPIATMELALPASTRRRVARVRGRPLSRASVRLERNPLFAFFVLALAWWAWHAPTLYDAAVRHAVVHALEHLTLLAAGVCWWQCVLGRRRTTPAKALALTIATALYMNVLGALLTLAPRAFYGVYAGAYGMTALQDQQFGGVLMWSIGGFEALVLLVHLTREVVGHDDEPVEWAAVAAPARAWNGPSVAKP